MAKNLMGVTVSCSGAIIVLLIQQNDGTLVLQTQTQISLQQGERAEAYNIFHDQFSDYVRQNRVDCVGIKGSSVNQGGTTLSHLEAAELRGVVQAAAVAGGAEVKITIKASVSRKLARAGKRKVDEYLSDNSHWTTLGLADVKKGWREAAFSILNHFQS